MKCSEEAPKGQAKFQLKHWKGWPLKKFPTFIRDFKEECPILRFLSCQDLGPKSKL
jgi:hypothetical protein